MHGTKLKLSARLQIMERRTERSASEAKLKKTDEI